MNIYEVKAILGHADIKTTMRYAHLEQRDVSSKARDVINSLNKETEKPDLKIVEQRATQACCSHLTSQTRRSP